MSTRTRGVTTKPIIINLLKTDLGYQLDGSEAPSSTTISIPKTAIAKTESNATTVSQAKTSTVNALAPTSTKKKPLIQKSTPAQKVTPTASDQPNTAIISNKSATSSSKMDTEPKKREIFPFTNLAEPLTNPADTKQSAVKEEDFKSTGEPLAVNREGADFDTIANKLAESRLKKHPVVLPSCAHWFDMQEIHQIEKDSLPEFFAGKPSKTPQIYKRYRNYIIHLYRGNPRTYLNATTCRRNLAGDACAILRIHSFLEHWGIINFSVDPSSYQHNVLLTKPADTNDRILQFAKSEEGRLDFFEHEKKLFGRSGDNDLMLNHIKMITKGIRPVCDYCGLICGVVWFQQRSMNMYQNLPNDQIDQNQPLPSHITKGGELVLCVKCFTEGNIPNILSAQDFVKVDLITRLQSGQPVKGQSAWSQDETLQLLDLIAKYNDNWKLIQSHFPSRTKEDIILHFLQLPAKNVTSINLLESNDQSDDRLPIEKVADSQTSTLNDYSNPLLQHVAIFKSLLEKSRLQQSKNEDQTMIAEDTMVSEKDEKKEAEFQTINDKIEETDGAKEQEKQKKKVAQEFKNKLQKLSQVSGKEAEIVLELEKETKNRAKKLEAKEDHKIKDLANLLIDIQLSKLETKLQFLEEYEKIIWHEKKQLEVLQKMQIAERVHVILKKNELYKQQQQHQALHPALPSHVPAQQQPMHHHSHHHHALPSGGMSNLVGNGSTTGQQPQQSHHMMGHREDGYNRGGPAPSGGNNPHISFEDMLNLGGMEKMEDEFGKGDQL